MNQFLVTCKSCGAANRIPADKEGMESRCGNCHGSLAPLYWQPRQLSEAQFDDFVAGYQGPVVAEFWAPW